MLSEFYPNKLRNSPVYIGWRNKYLHARLNIQKIQKALPPWGLWRDGTVS